MGRVKDHNWYNWCDFGEHEIEEGQRIHVFPIPACEAFPKGGEHVQDGATACAGCFPSTLAAQIEQGLVGRG